MIPLLDVLVDLVRDDEPRRAQLHETAARLVVTVPDALDDRFHLWRLDQLQQLKFDRNLQHVSGLVVLFDHQLSQQMLIVDALDVAKSHLLDSRVEYAAHVL